MLDRHDLSFDVGILFLLWTINVLIAPDVFSASSLHSMLHHDSEEHFIQVPLSFVGDTLMNAQNYRNHQSV